jgi:hypothetical protein
VNPHVDATELSFDSYIAAVASPVLVFDRHLDVINANQLAGAVSASFRRGTNLARFTFLNPMVEETTADWNRESRRTVAVLRELLSGGSEDQRFRVLLGELMARSEAFAELWGGSVDTPETHGTSVFNNPLVGAMRLSYEHFHRPNDDEHVVMLWVPADRVSAERLDRLRERVSAC